MRVMFGYFAKIRAVAGAIQLDKFKVSKHYEYNLFTESKVDTTKLQRFPCER